MKNNFDSKTELIKIFDSLNREGQEMLMKYANLVRCCDKYNKNIIAVKGELFTVGKAGERIYASVNESNAITAALLKKEVFIDNNYSGDVPIGGAQPTDNSIKSVAIIPLEAKSGDVIGVVVCKNKADGFSREDVKKFDLGEGEIGSAFRMGLENKALKAESITDRRIVFRTSRSGIYRPNR